MNSNKSDDQVFTLKTTSGLLVEASATSRQLLTEFYRNYDTAFVLANEKEEYAGFEAILGLNSGAAYSKLRHHYGIFREFIMVVSDPETGLRIGGANFIAFLLPTAAKTSQPILSVNLNYIFTNPNVRNRGYFSRLVGDFPLIAWNLLLATNCDDIARQKNTAEPAAELQPPTTLLFIEQNDPFLMSAEDYQQDTQYAGIDQIARINLWTKLGAKIIDFPYVQPPLSSLQDADHSLVYAVIGAEKDSLDPELLHDHLERFFAISVLKGQEASAEPTAAKQLALLKRLGAQGTRIPLLDAMALPGTDNVPDRFRPASLRKLLRQQAALIE